MQTPGRQRTTRAGEVPLVVKPGRQPARAGEHARIRHVAFAVEDIDAVVAGPRARGAELVGELERYEDSYRLCYVRGPEGIIIELAEQIG
jgi:catechol 2,3-dioxygenase-like lactoylglutathione lyase family enzyme